MSYSCATSPVLYATPFVGRKAPHKDQEGKLWLSCAEFGFSFCAAGIDPSFGPIKHGDIIRLEVRTEAFFGSKPFPLDQACSISGCADAMLGHLFGGELGDDEWERGVLKHLGFDNLEPDDPDYVGLEYEIPGHVHYSVRRL